MDGHIPHTYWLEWTGAEAPSPVPQVGEQGQIWAVTDRVHHSHLGCSGLPAPLPCRALPRHLGLQGCLVGSSVASGLIPNGLGPHGWVEGSH